jgi:hypothetical protein
MPNFDALAKSWDKYRHPWKPHKESLKSLSSFITPNKKICLLWSTKEVRLLCKGQDISIDIYDMSWGMYRVNSVDNKQESFIQENWFDIKNKKYDLIFWDLILFLFSREEQNRLIDVLKSNLSAEWVILLRIWWERDYTDMWNYYKELWEYKKIGFDAINKVSYELKIWAGIGTNEMLSILKQNNTLAYDFFYENFRHLVPYGNMDVEKISPNIDYVTLYRDDFTLSHESIIQIT